MARAGVTDTFSFSSVITFSQTAGAMTGIADYEIQALDIMNTPCGVDSDAAASNLWCFGVVAAFASRRLQQLSPA